MIFEVCKNGLKMTKVRHLGGQRFNSCAARRNVRGRRGGKEGLKPLRVWQGSWARHLKPRIQGLGNLGPGKTRQEPSFWSSTPCSPLGGGAAEGACAHSAGPVYGFVSVWCVGLLFFSFCDQILCEKPTCEDLFQILFIS